MHDEVWVAADGRGEVCVAGAGQSEVAFVFLGVAGLLERAQHEVGEDAFFRRAGDAADEFLVELRRDGDAVGDFVLLRGAGVSAACGALARIATVGLHGELADGQVAEAEGVSEASGGLFKVDDALGVGHLVDAIHAGDALLFEPGGDALVGGEHELFDEPVGPAALGADDGLHVAVGVELDDGFGEIEVDGAAADTLGVEAESEFEHGVEGGGKLRSFEGDALAFGEVFGGGRRTGLRAQGPGSRVRVAERAGVETLLNRGVGHTADGADDAFGDAIADDFAARVDLHDAAHDESVFVGEEAAHAAGESVRQHGHGAVGEVDAVAA